MQRSDNHSEVGNKKVDFQLVTADYIDLLKQKSTQLEKGSLSQIDFTLKDLLDKEIKAPSIPEAPPNMPSAIPEALFKTGKALARSKVIINCRTYKKEINLFWHNLLTHFIYIYLPNPQNAQQQIGELIQSLLNNDNTVIDNLLKNKIRILEMLRSQNNNGPSVVATNAANGKFVGGVATYGEGSAEESLCRESDLFLSMVLNHCDGDYQKNILLGMLEQFDSMLTNESVPISNDAQQSDHEAKELAEKWVDLITKPSFEGYGIYYNATTQEGRLHQNNIILTGNMNALPKISDLAKGEGREAFLENVYFNIDVLDIASRDLRIIGSNPTERFTTTDGNFNQIFQDTFEIASQKGSEEQPCSLIVLPLGCGAFGNEASEVGQALMEEMTKDSSSLDTKNINSITLATLEDNFQALSGAIENVLEEDFEKANIRVLPALKEKGKEKEKEKGNEIIVENNVDIPTKDQLDYKSKRQEIFKLLQNRYSSEEINYKNIDVLSRKILLEIQQKERAGFPKDQLIEYMDKMYDALNFPNPHSIKAFKDRSLEISGESSPLKILGGLGLILAGAIEIALGMTLALTGSILSYGVAAPISVYAGSTLSGIGIASVIAGCGLFKSGIKSTPDNVDKLTNALSKKYEATKNINISDL